MSLILVTGLMNADSEEVPDTRHLAFERICIGWNVLFSVSFLGYIRCRHDR